MVKSILFSSVLVIGLSSAAFAQGISYSSADADTGAQVVSSDFVAVAPNGVTPAAGHCVDYTCTAAIGGPAGGAGAGG